MHQVLAKASDLAKLGLTTKLSGSALEISDLAISITGNDGFSIEGKVSTNYSSTNSYPAIENPLEIKFTTNTLSNYRYNYEYHNYRARLRF